MPTETHRTLALSWIAFQVSVFSLRVLTTEQTRLEADGIGFLCFGRPMIFWPVAHICESHWNSWDAQISTKVIVEYWQAHQLVLVREFHYPFGGLKVLLLLEQLVNNRPEKMFCVHNNGCKALWHFLVKFFLDNVATWQKWRPIIAIGNACIVVYFVLATLCLTDLSKDLCDRRHLPEKSLLRCLLCLLFS